MEAEEEDAPPPSPGAESAGCRGERKACVSFIGEPLSDGVDDALAAAAAAALFPQRRSVSRCISTL